MIDEKDFKDIIKYLYLERLNYSLNSKKSKRIKELIKILIKERETSQKNTNGK